ncbi:MAG: hypothetical protein JNN07_03540 [Verrucomicrobiales bacterium]|nr:hypothetical protein [Verrucomicrobiales bacterium]
MNATITPLIRNGALLAINLLILMVWGFAGIDKLRSGVPSWFDGKFGPTFLASFPGLTATFWLLTASELAAFLLAAIALGRGEFIRRSTPIWLLATLVWSLFVFLQLALGQWLTADYNGTFQMFTYFGLTLLMLHFVMANQP